MSRPASDVALAAAFGSVVTALAYPLAAPVIRIRDHGRCPRLGGLHLLVRPVRNPVLLVLRAVGLPRPDNHRLPRRRDAPALRLRGLDPREGSARSTGASTATPASSGVARSWGRRNDFWDGRGTPKSAGLVLGACKGGYWYDSSVPHALCVGKTGSGKPLSRCSSRCTWPWRRVETSSPRASPRCSS